MGLLILGVVHLRVIRQDRLADFCEKHEDKRLYLQCWLVDAENAAWECTDDVLKNCKSTELTGADVVAFTIGMGTIRVVAKVLFRQSIVRIDEIGLSV